MSSEKITGSTNGVQDTKRETAMSGGSGGGGPKVGQTSPGEFDPKNLRLSQNFGSSADVERMLVTVPVRKPDRQWFVRVHPDENYRVPTAVLEVKEDREMYLVARSLWSALPAEIVPMQLYTAINRQGVLFLWPVRLPAEDGRILEWHRSAAEAAEMAMKSWIRVSANMSLGAYEMVRALGDLPEPEWPKKPFGEILQIAFKDRLITSLDHPAIRRLRGEA